MELNSFKLHIPHTKDEDAEPTCIEGSCGCFCAACDGLGGAGVAKIIKIGQDHSSLFPTPQEENNAKTQAWHASRWLKEALQNYFENKVNQPQAFVFVEDELKEEIGAVFQKHSEEYSFSNAKILPSTLASFIAKQNESTVTLDVLWAGDSRVFAIDEDGFHLLSKDDCNGEFDVFINKDSTMTNKVNYVNDYHINHLKYEMNKPGIVFACSDGCFDYENNVLSFAAVMVDAFERAFEDGKISSDKLTQIINARYSEDDRSLAGVAVGDDEGLSSLVSNFVKMKGNLARAGERLSNFNRELDKWFSTAEGEKYLALKRTKQALKNNIPIDVKYGLMQCFSSAEKVENDAFVRSIDDWNRQNVGILQGSGDCKILSNIPLIIEKEKKKLQIQLEESENKIQSLQAEIKKINNEELYDKVTLQLCYEFLQLLQHGECSRNGQRFSMEPMNLLVNYGKYVLNLSAWKGFEKVAKDIFKFKSEFEEKHRAIKKSLEELDINVPKNMNDLMQWSFNRKIAEDKINDIKNNLVYLNRMQNTGLPNLLVNYFKVVYDNVVDEFGYEQLQCTFETLQNVFDSNLWFSLRTEFIKKAYTCLRILNVADRMQDVVFAQNIFGAIERVQNGNDEYQNLNSQLKEAISAAEEAQQGLVHMPNIQDRLSVAINSSEIEYYLADEIEAMFDESSEKYKSSDSFFEVSKMDAKIRFANFGENLKEYFAAIDKQTQAKAGYVEISKRQQAFLSEYRKEFESYKTAQRGER